VGVEVLYLGADEVDWLDGGLHLTELDHGTVGLVVRNHPGVRGRAAGTLGPDDRGFGTVHGCSEVAYLCAAPVSVAAQADRPGVRAADQFRNLEPEGVPVEVAQQRLAAYQEHDAQAEVER
jgi:hypothetical protein